MRHYITKSKSGHYTLTIKNDNGNKIGCYRKLPDAESARTIFKRFQVEGPALECGVPFERL